MSARLTVAEKREFASEQFDELVSMGLNKRTAGQLMSVVGPALAVETLQWLMGAWEAVEKYLCSRYHLEGLNQNVVAWEVRSKLDSIFLQEGTLDPKSLSDIQRSLRLITEVTGSSPLDFDLCVPPEKKLQRILRGAKILLDHLPLTR